MRLFNYKADRLPITIILALFIIDFMVYLTVDSVPFLIFWIVLGVFPKGNICAWNHHHQHCFTFKNPLLNRGLEIIYALMTGITGFTWVLHHNLGHHMNYLDQAKDESRWKDDDGKMMGRLQYALVTAATSYLRAFKVGAQHPRIKKGFLGMFFITFGILIGLTLLRPIPALMVYWIPMLISLLITVDATYGHHSGLDTQDPNGASRNIISPWYNRFTGNLGYHTAHHQKFGLHWSKLPELHEKLKADIPEHCYGQPMAFVRWLDKVS